MEKSHVIESVQDLTSHEAISYEAEVYSIYKLVKILSKKYVKFLKHILLE